MKNIITALALVGLTCAGANAQTTQINSCGVKHDKICRMIPGQKTASCYNTKFAENYKVCKGDFGYYICCEAPNYYNSTHPGYIVVNNKPKTVVVAYNDDDYTEVVNKNDNATVDMTTPQSQSYVMSSSNSYSGYYPKKVRIKVCYTGNNVAANTRAPYEGCSSPQSEGPEVNKQRNLNVSTPISLPPSSGRPME